MAGEYAPNVEGTYVGGGGDSMGTFVPSAPGRYVDIGGGGDQSNVVFVPKKTPQQEMQEQAAPPWLPPEDYAANGYTPQGNSVAADAAATAAAKDLYEAILHRPADAGGLEANKNAILAGSSIAELAKNMLASEEQQTFINRAKTNLISLGKKPEEVDALINDYTKNIIDTAGAVQVSPTGYNSTIKILDGSTMVSPGVFQRPDGSIINIDNKTGDIISATPPYSTYNNSVQINTGYRNNTYSKGTMDGQTSININGVDVPLITPEYLVNPQGKLLVSKEKLPVTIQSIEPPKQFNDGLGGVGDFLNGPGGLAIMLSLATAGAASGVALAAATAGSGVAAGTTLTSLIGSAVGLTGTAATVAGGAVLGSSASALMAAATGGNIMQAAIKGAVGGGIGAASLGIANAIMPEGSIQAIASATGQTVNQVSNIITNAISTSVSAAATGNFNGNVLSLIGTSLGSSVLANYASNIVNSLDPGNLNNVTQAVKAVTQVGTSAMLSGKDFSTAVQNNAGQIIGNYISSTIGPTLKNSAGAVADKLGTAANTLLDANGQPTNDSSKATSISLGDGKAIPLETYKTAYQDELKTQYAPLASNITSDVPQPLVPSSGGGVTVQNAALISPYLLDPQGNLMHDANGNPIPTGFANQSQQTGITGTETSTIPINPGSIASNTGDAGTPGISEEEHELARADAADPKKIGKLTPTISPPTADQNYLNNSWSDFLQGLTLSPSAYDTSGLTAYTGGDVVPTPGATPGTGPGGTGPGGTGPGGTGPGGTGPGGTGPGGTGPGGTGPGGTGPGGTGPGGTGTITVPGTPGTKTPGTKTTTTKTPGSITAPTRTPIMPTIPQFGMSDIADLTPGLTKATPFQFADNPTFTNQLTPMPTQSNTDYTQQILNAATGGSTTPDIVDLKPGLTEKRTFKFADEPSFTSALNQIPSQSFADYTQQILNAAHGGLIHMATGGDLPEYPEAPSPFLPAHTVRGRRRFNFFDGAHLPGYTREEYAEGGDVEGHNPEFFSEGGLESMENRFVRGDGDGTSDSVPAMLANGEFVIPADVVSKLGNGSNDSGAEILDEFLAVIREHNQKHNPRELPPDSRGPLAYLSEAKRKVG